MRLAIDLITRDENIRWLFHADTVGTQVDALAGVLAESMAIPDAERDALQQRAPYGHRGGRREREHRCELGRSDRFRGGNLRRRVGPGAAALGRSACPLRVRALLTAYSRTMQCVTPGHVQSLFISVEE